MTILTVFFVCFLWRQGMGEKLEWQPNCDTQNRSNLHHQKQPAGPARYGTCTRDATQERTTARAITNKQTTCAYEGECADRTTSTVVQLLNQRGDTGT